MGDLGESVLTLRTDNAPLEQGLRSARQKADQVASGMRRTGAALSAAVTLPIVGAFTASLAAFDEEARALAQIDTLITSTGGAAERTKEELDAMASGLQNVTRFGNEEILLGVTSQLLTFTNIAGEAFDRTQKVVLDVSTVIGQDLTSASIMLGKALNDPVANLGALGRSGIQFSEDQKTLIKTLADTGQLAEAQNIILSELEKQYGGTAEAAAGAGLGGLKQLQNSIGDLGEQIGGIIAGAITPLIGWVRTWVDWFSELDTRTKTIIVVVAGAAAAIGPLLIALGLIIPAVTALVPIIAAVFSTGGAIGVGIAAIVAFVAANDETRAKVVEIWNNVVEAVGPLLEILKKAVKLLGDNIVAAWKVYGPVITGIFVDVFTTIGQIIESAIGIVTGIIEVFVAATTGDWDLFAEGIGRIWRSLWDLIVEIVVGPIRTITNAVGNFTDGVTGAFRDMWDKVVGNSYVPDMIDGIESHFGRLTKGGLLGVVDQFTGGVISQFAGMAESILGSIRGVTDGIGDLISGRGGGGVFGGGGGGFFGTLGAAASAGSSLFSFGKDIYNLFGQGRKAADQYVQGIYSPFQREIRRLIRNADSASPAELVAIREDVLSLIRDFEGASGAFASQGGKNPKVVSQGMITARGLINPILDDLDQRILSAGGGALGDPSLLGGNPFEGITTTSSQSLLQRIADILLAGIQVDVRNVDRIGDGLRDLVDNDNFDLPASRVTG